MGGNCALNCISRLPGCSAACLPLSLHPSIVRGVIYRGRKLQNILISLPQKALTLINRNRRAGGRKERTRQEEEKKTVEGKADNGARRKGGREGGREEGRKETRVVKRTLSIRHFFAPSSFPTTVPRLAAPTRSLLLLAPRKS